MFKLRDYDYKNFEYRIIAVILVLGCIGMFLIRRAQSADENLFEKQLLGYALGMVVMLIVSLVDYHFIAKFFIPLYLLNLGLLMFCEFTDKTRSLSMGGISVFGYAHFTAKRWIKIVVGSRSMEFMPSELTKIIMIIFIAKYFELTRKYTKKLIILIISAILMGIPTLFVLMQPDLSTSIILISFYAFLVLATGITMKILFPLILSCIPIAYVLFWYVQQDFQHLLNFYQKNRVMALLHPDLYPKERYQQENAAVAIRSGELFGKLLTGNNDLADRGWIHVPVKESDFIFSMVGEEFGILGCFTVIALYFFLIVLGIRVAKRAKDYLGRLIAIGIISFFGLQAFVNMGVVTSLLPNTGIPLPFVSSGLSALLSNLMSVGILLNISMQPRKRKSKKLSDSIVKKDNNMFINKWQKGAKVRL